MNPNKEHSYNNQEAIINQGVDMEPSNTTPVDPRIIEAIGNRGFLIDESPSVETGKITLTEQDEEDFAEALGRFIKGRMELNAKIKAGAIKPADAQTIEKHLLDQYKTEIKAVGKSAS